MSTKDISTARNPDLRNSLAALHRAAKVARDTAIRTNTPLVVRRHGVTVEIPAWELIEEDARNAAGTS